MAPKHFNLKEFLIKKPTRNRRRLCGTCGLLCSASSERHPLLRETCARVGNGKETVFRPVIFSPLCQSQPPFWVFFLKSAQAALSHHLAGISRGWHYWSWEAKLNVSNFASWPHKEGRARLLVLLPYWDRIPLKRVIHSNSSLTVYWFFFFCVCLSFHPEHLLLLCTNRGEEVDGFEKGLMFRPSMYVLRRCQLPASDMIFWIALY